MKINIQKETSIAWKQTYYKLNSPLAELYDEFAYYNDDQHIWFEQSASEQRNSLSIALDGIPKLIEQGLLIDTYKVQPKRLRLDSIANKYTIRLVRDEDEKYSVSFESTDNWTIRGVFLSNATKQEYINFINKLKEFADE